MEPVVTPTKICRCEVSESLDDLAVTFPGFCFSDSDVLPLTRCTSNLPVYNSKSDEPMCSSLLTLRDSRGIQTHNLLIRSQMLYSVELGSHPFLHLRVQRYGHFLKQPNIFSFFFSFARKKLQNTS